MCKIRQSCNHFSSADPQMNLQPHGFGASVGLMKTVATAGDKDSTGGWGAAARGDVEVWGDSSMSSPEDSVPQQDIGV